MRNDFRLVERPHGSAWLHKTAPVWVVLYPGIEGSMTHRFDSWQAFKAIEGCHGRDPWTVNNKRIGPELGWPSAEYAFQAAEEEAARFAL